MLTWKDMNTRCKKEVMDIGTKQKACTYMLRCTHIQMCGALELLNISKNVMVTVMVKYIQAIEH